MCPDRRAVVTSQDQMSRSVTPSSPSQTFRFGDFELDLDRAELRRAGRQVRLQPQPMKLLAFFLRTPGTVVTREDIRGELWPDGTFVDFDQAVNFAIKQVRDALGDSAEKPLYLQTLPRRGYRFIAPVEGGAAGKGGNDHPREPGTTTIRLQKALWSNIAELKVAERRQRRMTAITVAAAVVVLGALIAFLMLAR
jgi:DNA-binding winged helix-turn-helix (wHTH) protein